jgi:hypothetical protein
MTHVIQEAESYIFYIEPDLIKFTLRLPHAKKQDACRSFGTLARTRHLTLIPTTPGSQIRKAA